MTQQGTSPHQQVVDQAAQQAKQATPVALASLLQLSSRLNSVLDERQYLVVKLVAQHIAQEALGIARQVGASSLGRGLQVGARVDSPQDLQVVPELSNQRILFVGVVLWLNLQGVNC